MSPSFSETNLAGSPCRPKKASPDISTIRNLEIEQFAIGKLEKCWLTISVTALGPVNVPVFVYRGSTAGPTVGIIGAIHGNEVNGIPVIQQIFSRMEERLGLNKPEIPFPGCIIGVPVLNVPGFLDSVRSYDGHDLNRLMPGNPNGAAAQQYAHRVFHDIVEKMDFVFDLHTASAGRQNSLYVRADMNDLTIHQMAKDLCPQIIVHNSSPGGSLRGCAQRKGIKALTIEIGNPSIFQNNLISRTVEGIFRTLIARLGYPTCLSTEGTLLKQNNPAICCRSYWLFSRTAGILQVFKKVADTVKAGEIIAEIHSVFGELLQRIVAPDDHNSVIVGLELNPVAKTGNRIVHLGVLGEDYLDGVNDGHL